MLNLSENNIHKRFDKGKFSAFDKVSSLQWERWLRKSLVIFAILVLVFLFLPWTQNVSSKGYLTTLYPDQRPQTVHTIIAGRLEKWYVKEGDFVNQGDTLVFISEVKSEYFDPSLVNRTSDQVDFKSKSIEAYSRKIEALQRQLTAFKEMKSLKIKHAKNKLKQARVKVKSDSVDYIAMN